MQMNFQWPAWCELTSLISYATPVALVKHHTGEVASFLIRLRSHLAHLWATSDSAPPL